MLLTEDQKFFLAILRETSCVRADHVLPLLHLQFPDKTQYQADAMLRTLRYQGKVVPGEDNIIRLAERRSAPPCRSPDRSSAPAECFMRAYTAKTPWAFRLRANKCPWYHLDSGKPALCGAFAPALSTVGLRRGLLMLRLRCSGTTSPAALGELTPAVLSLGRCPPDTASLPRSLPYFILV